MSIILVDLFAIFGLVIFFISLLTLLKFSIKWRQGRNKKDCQTECCAEEGAWK